MYVSFLLLGIRDENILPTYPIHGLLQRKIELSLGGIPTYLPSYKIERPTFLYTDCKFKSVFVGVAVLEGGMYLT